MSSVRSRHKCPCLFFRGLGGASCGEIVCGPGSSYQKMDNIICCTRKMYLVPIDHHNVGVYSLGCTMDAIFAIR